MSSEALVGVFQDESGLVLVGDEADVLDVIRHFELPSEQSLRLPPDLLSKAGALFQGIGDFQSQSARWLQLTDESMARVQQLGFSHAKGTQLITGVLRGDQGRIAQHLTFASTTLNPAMLASIGSLATSMAIQAAIKDMKKYLELMDKKLDRLLIERKVEALAELGGTSAAIDEAATIYEALGSVSSTTWSKVQANATDLHVVQALALENLQALADEVESTGTTAKLGDMAPRIQQDVVFWLGVLAEGIALQDKLYVLEIGRVLAATPDEAEAHRAAIQMARSARRVKVHRTTRAIAERLRVAGVLPNHIKVTHPVKAARVVSAVNAVNHEVALFARHAQLEELILADMSDVKWADAARILLDDTAAGARAFAGQAVIGTRSFGQTAAAGVKSLGAKVEEVREQAILDKAEKVREKRQLSDRTTNGDLPGELPSDGPPIEGTVAG